MADVISDYQKWKQQGEELRVKAKSAMEARFRDLLLEAIRVSEEYRTDFGGVLKPPPSVTAFRFKAGAARKPKKNVAKVAAQAPAKANPKIALLQRQLAAAKAKMEAAKAAGKPTRNLDDKIYEIEDALQAAMK